MTIFRSPSTMVLMAKIKALLRRAYAYMEIKPEAIEHDGLVLNFNDGQILYGGQRAELTRNKSKY